MKQIIPLSDFVQKPYSGQAYQGPCLYSMQHHPGGVGLQIIWHVVLKPPAGLQFLCRGGSYGVSTMVLVYTRHCHMILEFPVGVKVPCNKSNSPTRSVKWETQYYLLQHLLSSGVYLHTKGRKWSLISPWEKWLSSIARRVPEVRFIYWDPYWNLPQW